MKWTTIICESNIFRFLSMISWWWPCWLPFTGSLLFNRSCQLIIYSHCLSRSFSTGTRLFDIWTDWQARDRWWLNSPSTWLTKRTKYICYTCVLTAEQLLAIKHPVHYKLINKRLCFMNYCKTLQNFLCNLVVKNVMGCQLSKTNNNTVYCAIRNWILVTFPKITDKF